MTTKPCWQSEKNVSFCSKVKQKKVSIHFSIYDNSPSFVRKGILFAKICFLSFKLVFGISDQPQHVYHQQDLDNGVDGNQNNFFDTVTYLFGTEAKKQP